MNRRNFFRNIGIGAVVSCVAPTLAAKEITSDVGVYGGDISHIPLKLDPKEVLRIWRQTGNIYLNESAYRTACIKISSNE